MLCLRVGSFLQSYNAIFFLSNLVLVRMLQYFVYYPHVSVKKQSFIKVKRQFHSYMLREWGQSQGHVAFILILPFNETRRERINKKTLFLNSSICRRAEEKAKVIMKIYNNCLYYPSQLLISN